MEMLEEESEEANVCLPQGSRWTFQATTMDGSFVSSELQLSGFYLTHRCQTIILVKFFLQCLFPTGITHHLSRADAGESQHVTLQAAFSHLTQSGTN